jgi:hypothetical protein
MRFGGFGGEALSNNGMQRTRHQQASIVKVDCAPLMPSVGHLLVL